ncbi:hypothetical protein GW17_00000642 [Ensete ventricosum]|uniref:Uncharacterized protein n=1 Tax=Ensete ventricosum TaxID=4639 RepID=A0A444GI87_ENSVE|nr:hypothetical protein GW17_00000642 [Ensete ventricosum]RZR72829.1 hypothetical protein BHM03_00017555 [Ensete ventricosum]
MVYLKLRGLSGVGDRDPCATSAGNLDHSLRPNLTILIDSRLENTGNYFRIPQAHPASNTLFKYPPLRSVFPISFPFASRRPTKKS